MKQRTIPILAAATLALLVVNACFTKTSNSTDVDVNVIGPTTGTPTASPSPTDDCTATAMAPGAENDDKTVPQGGERVIGVSLFGPQNKPLSAECLLKYRPLWLAVAGTCTYVADHNGKAYAPASATVGSLCVAEVRVGTLPPGRLELKVTAAATSVRPRTADDGKPEPEPSPTPDDFMSIDR